MARDEGLDPRTPVLVGAGAVTQRLEDPTGAQEAAALMAGAARLAADDAGLPTLLGEVDLVLVPEGTWGYTDPGRLVGVGESAHTVVANIGVLQQTLLTRACTDIVEGRSEVALVVGGEAKHRALRAAIDGVEVPETDQAGAEPGELLAPSIDVLSRVEIERELAWPVRQYAVIESALRAADTDTDADADATLDALWAGFAAVAAGNPLAWTRDGLGPADLRPSEANPMLASPYTKRHASQWNVDQAAAVIVCSVAAAERLGIARDRWLFPHLAVESNHMVPLSERAEPGRCHAMAVAGERVSVVAGVAPGDIEHLDLYSCFPAAVRLQQRELGIGDERPLTVTGGMTFAGGPLNNYALGSLVAMVGVLRTDPGSVGLVSSVSGMVTKYGLGLWSTEPPAGGFVAEDISGEVEARTGVVEVDADYEGRARIVGWTVAHARGVPEVAVVLADTTGGRRVVATAPDPEVAAAMAAGEWVGTEVQATGGRFTLV